MTNAVTPTRKRFTPSQRAELRSLIEDNGYSRKEAEAWVEAFGTKPDDTIPCPPPTFEEDVEWFEAEKARLDARPRFSTGRLWKHAVAMTCRNCGHDFLADSTSLWPEGHQCPECDVVTP